VCTSSQHAENKHLFVCPLCCHSRSRHESFSTNFLASRTFLLGVNQMHVVISLGAVFPMGAAFWLRTKLCLSLPTWSSRVLSQDTKRKTRTNLTKESLQCTLQSSAIYIFAWLTTDHRVYSVICQTLSSSIGLGGVVMLTWWPCLVSNVLKIQKHTLSVLGFPNDRTFLSGPGQPPL